MARHVESYADEWKATLEDPDKLARFVSFVNAPDTPDPNITFTEERGQIKPADGRGARRAGQPRSPWAPRRGRGVARTRSGSRSAPSTTSRSSAASRRWCTARRSRSSAPTTTRSTRWATTTRSPARRCWPAASSAPAATCRSWRRPMHKHAFDLRTGRCLDDETRPRPGVRRRGRGGRRVGRGRRMTAAPRPLARATGSASPPPARPTSRSRCSSGAAREVEWAPVAVRWTPTGSTRPRCGRPPSGCSPRRSTSSSRPPASACGRGSTPRSRGACCRDLLGVARGAPRSWPADRRASARCAGAGCASCGRRSRSASRTCWRTCAAAT